MKLFKFALFATAVLADGHSTYEECRTPEHCDYTCGTYENCDGTGSAGIIRFSADKACCTMADAATICTGDENEDANCHDLPANITAITGAACKPVFL